MCLCTFSVKIFKSLQIVSKQFDMLGHLAKFWDDTGQPYHSTNVADVTIQHKTSIVLKNLFA